MALRDGFSNFMFYQALPPNDYFSIGGTTGPTIDTRGYETVTFLMATGQVSTSTASYFVIRMQHCSTSAAGNDGTWSDVSEGHIIGSNFSIYTAVTSGKVLSFCISAGSVSLYESTVYAWGYRGRRRYVRIVFESCQTAGSTVLDIVAVLGTPANWPVNTPL